MKEGNGLGIVGTLSLKVIDQNGNSTTRSYKNVVTTWGLSTMAAALTGVAVTPDINYLAIGTGTTTASVNDIALEAEAARELASVTKLSGVDSNKVIFYKLWAEGLMTGTWTEAGLFDAAVAGNMLNRRTFPPIVVDVTNSLEVSWTIEFLNT